MIVLGPRCAPDCHSSVSGMYIPIAKVTFTVKSGSEGTHTSAVRLRVVSMSTSATPSSLRDKMPSCSTGAMAAAQTAR